MMVRKESEEKFHSRKHFFLHSLSLSHSNSLPFPLFYHPTFLSPSKKYQPAAATPPPREQTIPFPFKSTLLITKSPSQWPGLAAGEGSEEAKARRG